MAINAEVPNSPLALACSSSARLRSKPDRKHVKSSSKNAPFATFSARHANLISTSLRWLPLRLLLRRS